MLGRCDERTSNEANAGSIATEHEATCAAGIFDTPNPKMAAMRSRYYLCISHRGCYLYMIPSFAMASEDV